VPLPSFPVPVLAADPAPAPAQDPGSTSPFGNPFILMAVIFLIFWMLVIRPQGKERKKRELLLKAIKKNDRVVTTAGLHGRVVSASDTIVVLEVADGVRMKFDRSAIWRVVEDEPAAETVEPAPSLGTGGKA
jgi:preprotein translocase subunit YajC